MIERERFYVAEEQFREDVRALLAPLTDDELDEVYEMFGVHHLISIPYRYHALTWKVRAAVKAERKRRLENATHE